MAPPGNRAGRARPKPGEAFAPASLGRGLLDGIDAAPDLCDSDKRLLIKLLRLAGNETWCRTTTEWLAGILGKSRRSVFYGLARLARRGLILRSRQGCRGTVFRFVWSSEYERFQQLSSGSVQEVAQFINHSSELCNPLHSNSATSCTKIVQPVAHITGITGRTGTGERASEKPNAADWPQGLDASDVFSRLWQRHPKKVKRFLAQQALAEALSEAPDPAALADRIEHVHQAWCASPDWTKEAGRYAPRLDRWLRDRGWLDGEPALADEEPVVPYRPYWEVEAESHG
jgi:predicted transcriptional regulator